MESLRTHRCFHAPWFAHVEWVLLCVWLIHLVHHQAHSVLHIVPTTYTNKSNQIMKEYESNKLHLTYKLSKLTALQCYGQKQELFTTQGAFSFIFRWYRASNKTVSWYLEEGQVPVGMEIVMVYLSDKEFTTQISYFIMIGLLYICHSEMCFQKFWFYWIDIVQGPHYKPNLTIWLAFRDWNDILTLNSCYLAVADKGISSWLESLGVFASLPA